MSDSPFTLKKLYDARLYVESLESERDALKASAEAAEKRADLTEAKLEAWEENSSAAEFKREAESAKALLREARKALEVAEEGLRFAEARDVYLDDVRALLAKLAALEDGT